MAGIFDLNIFELYVRRGEATQQFGFALLNGDYLVRDEPDPASSCSILNHWIGVLQGLLRLTRPMDSLKC